jgi:prepilin-type processing-associated H-X9-DG protein
LLVVIAIIAILAAILFPVFAKAREKARQTACLSNVKEICLAYLMYAQDYDEKFTKCETMCANGGTWGPAKYQYYLALNPYIKNWQIWACPSASGANNCPGTDNGSAHYVAVHQHITAGLVPANFVVNYVPMEGFNNNSYKMAQFKDPSETYMIGDAAAFPRLEEIAWANTCNLIPGGCGQGAVGETEDNTRHNGGSNLGFMDGHAKWRKAQDIVASNGIIYPY